MKKTILILLYILCVFEMKSKDCDEMIAFVQSKSYGTTYTSYNSDAISKVTFYGVVIDYKTYYFAVVCYKQKYSYSCSEYIYQVVSNTKMNYSILSTIMIVQEKLFGSTSSRIMKCLNVLQILNKTGINPKKSTC
jgi:hypothetical protein